MKKLILVACLTTFTFAMVNGQESPTGTGNKPLVEKMKKLEQPQKPFPPLKPEELKTVQQELMKAYPGTPPYPEPEIQYLHIRKNLFEKGKVTPKDKISIKKLSTDKSDPETANKLLFFQNGRRPVADPNKPISAEEMKRLQQQGLPVSQNNIGAAPVQAPRPTPQGDPNQQQQVPPVQQQGNSPQIDEDAPKFEFIGGDTYNYGDIIENPTPSEHIFEFKNVGKKPLIITEAHGSCGCTVPTPPKEPILPGMKSSISVKYSSQGRVGPINKDVIITANTVPPTSILHIRGNVKAANNPAPPQQTNK